MLKGHSLVYILVSILPAVACAEYQEALGTSGTLVMEAENFHTVTTAGAHTWTPLCNASIPAGALGDGAVQALPADGSGFKTLPYETNNPHLDYDVNFVGGNYEIWARGTAAASNQNSAHAGIDGTVVGSSGIGFPVGSYGWAKLPGGPYPVTAGSHIVNLFIREAGVIVDKIVFTTDGGFDGSIVPADTPNTGSAFLAAPPVFSPDAVTDPNEGFQAAGTVTDMTSCTSGATVYYTTDGVTTPTPASTNESVTPFTVPASPPVSTTVMAIASVSPASTHTDSTVVTAIFTADNAPVITSTPTLSATEDSPYSYGGITVTDADGDTTTITNPAAPGFLTFVDNGNNTATLSGTPTDSAVGTRTVTIIATDGSGATDTQTYTLTTANVPDNPVVTTPIGPQTSTQGSAFNLDVSANFNDDDPPSVDTQTFSTASLPAGTGLSLSTAGIFSGTPTQADVDASPISITVTISDSTTPTPLTASDTFNLTVTNINDDPLVATPITDQSYTQGTAIPALDVSGNFTDPDGDTMTFGATGLPASTGFAFSGAGVLTGTPTQADVDASPISVTVTANDGNTGTGSDTFSITATNINDTPQLDTAAGPQAATQGIPFGPLNLSGNFSDPDGDTLGYTISGLPAGSGLVISPTGTVSGTPTNADAQASVINATVTASDGILSAFDIIAFTITNVNDAPVHGSTANQSGAQGALFGPVDLSTGFSDPDGDALSFTSSGFPTGTGLSVNAAGSLSGTPTNADAQASPYTVTVTASDTSMASASGTFTMTVSDTNAPPVLVTPIGPQTATEGTGFGPLDVSTGFTDPDGDQLTFTISGLPNDTGLVMSSSGLLEGTPTVEDFTNQPVNVTVTATDTSGTSTSDTFLLSIAGLDSDSDGIIDIQEIANGMDPFSADSDSDGISDSVEVGPDPANPLDSDMDGIFDAAESGNLANDAQIADSLVLGDGSTVDIDVTSTGQTLSGVSASSSAGAPTGLRLPFGTIAYNVSSPVGGSVPVTMRFSSNLPSRMRLYKVDNNSYRALDSNLWKRVDDRTLVITLTDGDSETDLDGIANGVIVDPIAPASIGSGGCTLSVEPKNTTRDPLLLILCLLAGGRLFRRRGTIL